MPQIVWFGWHENLGCYCFEAELPNGTHWFLEAFI